MASKDVDKTVDHTATVHGYWMGGKDHFTASWEAAEELLRARPPPAGDGMQAHTGLHAGHDMADPAPHQLMPDRAAFWLLMQIGMIIGFATSWPANVWLVKRGIKVPM